MLLCLVLYAHGWVWSLLTLTLMHVELQLWRACLEATHWLRSLVVSVARPMQTLVNMPVSFVRLIPAIYVSIRGFELPLFRPIL